MIKRVFIALDIIAMHRSLQAKNDEAKRTKQEREKNWDGSLSGSMAQHNNDGFPLIRHDLKSYTMF